MIQQSGVMHPGHPCVWRSVPAPEAMLCFGSTQCSAQALANDPASKQACSCLLPQSQYNTTKVRGICPWSGVGKLHSWRHRTQSATYHDCMGRVTYYVCGCTCLWMCFDMLPALQAVLKEGPARQAYSRQPGRGRAIQGKHQEGKQQGSCHRLLERPLAGVVCCNGLPRKASPSKNSNNLGLGQCPTQTHCLQNQAVLSQTTMSGLW